jgi:5-methylcytosine-specific restriction endonuclease McrA
MDILLTYIASIVNSKIPLAIFGLLLDIIGAYMLAKSILHRTIRDINRESTSTWGSNPAFKRAISKETRSVVLSRNGFTCRMCGIGAGEPHPDDGGRKARLHIGHIVDKQQGGSDDPSNLRALCSMCNEGAANITPDPPTAMKLLAQIRKAKGNDQVQVLKWLVDKYPNEAKGMVENNQ